MYVSDTGTSWSYTDGYQASDYRVWGHIVDIVPSLKNRIDLSGKYAAGSITITTDLTYSDSAHLETRLTGAFDGSTDYWSGALQVGDHRKLDDRFAAKPDAHGSRCRPEI